MSSLVGGMSRLEQELHSTQEEKAALLSDLASVRELCVKVDLSKELTARQLTSKSMEVERVSQPARASTRLEQQHSFYSSFKHTYALSGHSGAGGPALRGGADQETAGQREADRPQPGDPAVLQPAEGVPEPPVVQREGDGAEGAAGSAQPGRQQEVSR